MEEVCAVDEMFLNGMGLVRELELEEERFAMFCVTGFSGVFHGV
jgi:hypothetical protein